MEGSLENVYLKGFDLIDWYELDPEVVKACYEHLPKISSIELKKVIVLNVFGATRLKV